jgi:predicted transcriptional regulator of viral defense system
LLIAAEQGPDILGDSNLLARASCVADPYYIGFATAAAHYGLTTQQRNIIRLTNSFKLSKQSNHGGTNQKTLGEKRATP